ncbi:MAG: Tfp pilus assembly protein FimT/FimU [Spirulinaceae cyanobacterium]
MNYFLFLHQKLARLRQRHPPQASDQAGFTLIELIVVVVMIAILAAILAPSWIGFLNQRRVNASENAIFRAINEAQSQARATNQPYSVSFRMNNGIPQAAVYQAQYVENGTADEKFTNPNGADFRFWENLGENIELKSGQVVMGTNITQNGSPNQASTTMQYGTNLTLSANAETGVNHTITFDERGMLMPFTEPDTGTNNTIPGLIITVAKPQGGNNGNLPVTSSARCVKVLTLIGSVRTDRGADCIP